MIKKLLLLFFLIFSYHVGKSQTVDLLAPMGGENWPVGSQQNIQWSYSNISFLKIEYSIDGGVNYNLIVSSVSASDNHFIWNVPATTSTNCKIKISDFFTGTFSQNQNAFSISVTPFFNLTSLNGGEVLTAGNNIDVTWTDSLVSSTVKIEYSGDDGNNWVTIVNNFANNNTYTWTVPNTPTTYGLIKISDAQNNLAFDISVSNFTIVGLPNPIEVFSPNGGESWSAGYVQTIQWSAPTITNVKIEISYDNGVNWTVIENSYPAIDGFYQWTATAPFATNSALIRISDAQNPSIFDESNFTFSIILPAPILDIYYPNGGESLAEGVPIDIIWNSINVTTLSIEYSINNGASWQLITSNAPAAVGSYTWLVPNTPSNFVLVRLSDNSNSSVSDQSTSEFSIISPQINIQNFPAGNILGIYSNLNLNWTSIGLSNQLLKLEYSINDGVSWIAFAYNVPNSGFYDWLINCPPVDSCRIKISVQNNPNVFAISPGAIKIIANGPSLLALTPLQQETLGAGTIYPITWFSYAINYVRIEYSLNGDTIFNLITPFTPAANGVFYWQVPVNLSAINCRIKISNAANTNLIALNPGIFSIQPGSYQVSSGNTTNVLLAGSTHQITWSSAGVSNYVNISYSIDSTIWTPIISNYQNSGSYAWNVPYINTDSVWYRVSDSNLNSTFDINDAPQKIIVQNEFLNFIQPDSLSIFATNSIVNLTWNSGGVSSVNLQYSIDGGTNWINIASNLNSSVLSYTWNVPSNPINSGLIRITDASNSLIFDQISFSTHVPEINLTSPNGGENWNTNFGYNITWQSIGVDFINLYYSSDGGANFVAIDTNVYNLGYYFWQTPLLASNNYKIKIVYSNDSTLNDVSNSVFILSNPSTTLSLLSPNGGEQLIANTGQYITWQSTGVSNINIEYSLNGGLNYAAIATNIAAVPAYYYWFVPDTQSATAKIKITSSSNSSLNDASNSNFTILDDSTQINVISPNGGEVFNSGSYQTIKWTAINSSFVKIYYSTNGGVTYNYLSTIINDSSFIWQIPAINSSNCKIKIENGNNASVFDESSSAFSINNQGLSGIVLTIDSLSNNNLCSGTNLPLSFTANGVFSVNNHFKVHLSDPMGSFSSFTEIGEIVSTTGATINCFIPSQIISGQNYTLRIVADNPVAISNNYSFGNITINNVNSDFNSDKHLVILPNNAVSFTPDANQSEIVNSSWNTGNGGIYSTFNALHQYNTVGKFDVLHTVTDTNGCVSSTTVDRMITVEHWFPNVIINTATSEEIADIDFENARYGCAIFKNGNCLITADSGKTWNIAYTNSINVKLNSLHLFNNAWYIATSNGSYLKSTNKGVNWLPITFNNYEGLNDIIFTSQNNGYAIGNNGKIFKFNGSIWQVQNSGTLSSLNKITSKNNTRIIVGNNSTILKLQNNIWSPVNAPVNVNFNSVCFKDSMIGFIASDHGFILKSTDAGVTWNVALSGADVHFKNLWVEHDTVWAVANEGIIYTSLNDGLTWNRYNIGEMSNLNSISYVNKTGFIVGENGLLRKFNNPVFVPVVDQTKDINANSTLHYFPNPTNNVVNIEFKNQDPNNILIKVIDIQGRLVAEKETINLNNSGYYTLDLSAEPEGIYFITIIANSNYQSFKIIKSN